MPEKQKATMVRLSNNQGVSDILAGYTRFYHNSEPGLFDQLASGQSPKALVIACCDSRVDPALVFDCAPGDLFVVRAIGAIVPSYHEVPKPCSITAALQFGVTQLNIPNIIVMGHSQCAGIKALWEQQGSCSESDFISGWVNVAAKARDRVLDESNDDPETPATAECCARETVRCSVEDLRTFPWISERESAGELNLYGWYFDLSNGCLEVYDPETSAYCALTHPS